MTIHRYETRAEWLEDRRYGLGGSDIATILGMDSFTSKLKVFYDKTEPLDPFADDGASEEMEMGQDIEQFIIGQWSKRQAALGAPPLFVDSDLLTITSNAFPFLKHSPDALLWDDIHRDRKPEAGLEVKNIGSDKNWDDPAYGGLPPRYYAQVQHGLLCSGLARWEVAALVRGQKLITRTVFPDKEMMGLIALEGEKFWREHVQAGFPPDPDGSESAGKALRERWSDSVGVSVEIPDELVDDLHNARRKAEEWKLAADTAAQRIQLEMGDAELAVASGDRKVATWKVGTRKAVDTKALRDEMQAVAEKYTKVTPTRTFRVL